MTNNTTEENLTMLGGLQKHQSPRNDGICPCINSAAGMGGGQTPIVSRPQYRVRKLTQKECWRLMGFSDMDFEKAKERLNANLYGGKDRSGSQLYKQAGNSIVVDVLYQIMNELYTAMPYLFEDIVAGSFFSGIGAFEKALSMLPDDSLTATSDQDSDINTKPELNQIGFINGYNGDANRIYDSTLARALKAEAGGGRSENRLVSHPAAVKVLGRVIPASLKVHQNQEVYEPKVDNGGGLIATIKATSYKDPPKVRWDGKNKN